MFPLIGKSAIKWCQYWALLIGDNTHKVSLSHLCLVAGIEKLVKAWIESINSSTEHYHLTYIELYATSDCFGQWSRLIRMSWFEVELFPIPLHDFDVVWSSLQRRGKTCTLFNDLSAQKQHFWRCLKALQNRSYFTSTGPPWGPPWSGTPT